MRRRRTKLTRIRGALTQSLKGLSGFASGLNSLVARLDALIRRIDSNIRSLIEASSQSQQAYARLQRIPGVRPVVGSADAFVAFCGWDPRPDDS